MHMPQQNFRKFCLAGLLWALVSQSALCQTEVEVSPLAEIGLQQESQIITVPLNKVNTIRVSRDIAEVIIGNADIADVIVKTQNRAYIIGRSTGDTDILLIDSEGDLINHIVARVGSNIEAAAAAIAQVVDDSQIELSPLKNNILMQGVVHTAKESADAAEIARNFLDPENEAATVVNMLQVLGDQQVLLKVRMAEMQRNVLKDLGMNTNFSLIRGDGALIFDITTNGVNSLLNTEGTARFSVDSANIPDATFSALERQGLVKTLAEPALTAISGETANFLAGGEFPTVAGIDNTGNVLIEFREFGVALAFTPVVMAENRISLKISTEVSRVSSENVLTLPVNAGATTVDVVGLSVRKAESTINLPSGGSLMIAGLLQNDEITTVDGIPWLRDVPVIGALFRSPNFVQNQSELVVIVEAFIVRPVDGGEQKLALPTDGFVSPSDLDLLLLGRLYKRYGGDKMGDRNPLLQGPLGYLLR